MCILPFFYLGHSWGSLMGQDFIQQWGNELNGCILSGTIGKQPKIMLKAGRAIAKRQVKKHGPKFPSESMINLTFGSFNKPWNDQPGATGFEWLSRDKNEVKKYVDDPWCGFIAPAGFYVEMMTGLLKIWDKTQQVFVRRGMYEVLEYESTLELLDKRGKRAHFRKREKVRYLQDNIIAYQDQAWGDGEILLNYRCAPGVPVDRYTPGQETYVLISLREVKNRGDVDEFHIEWGIRNGFGRKSEQWETDINHRTKQLKIQIIFPKDRKPIKAVLKESIRQKTSEIRADLQQQLPDGRHLIYCEKQNPRLYEKFILAWKW